MLFVKDAIAQGELPKIEEPEPTASAEESKTEAANSTETAAKNATVQPPRIITHKLTTTIKYLSVLPLSEAQKVDSRAKCVLASLL